MRTPSLTSTRAVLLLASASLALAAPSTAAPPGRHGGGAPRHERRRARPTPRPAAPAYVPTAVAPGSGAAQGTTGNEGNWLAANGLTSPACRFSASLTAIARANCRRTGTVALPVPVDRYGLDVHIDRGVLGVGGSTLASVIQGVLVTPVWQAVLYSTHGIVVALGWAYGLDLVGRGALSPISRALTGAQRTLTGPWLGLALALAAAGVCWQGLVRRRVAQSLGDVALAAIMILGGLWVAAHPASSVGLLDKTANDASLGTLAAISTGDPNHADGDFATSLQLVFQQAVVKPWAFLEFGQVDWATDPRRRSAALFQQRTKLEAKIRQDHGSSVDLDLLRAARTNGDLFLAFPTNTSARNSINRSDSLYRALCGSDNDNACTAPTAAQAEFRTESGTWPRVGGLLLILVGALGMVCLLGFLAFRLLAAALLALFYLVLAPVVVLVPVLGERGRAAFRAWGIRLLGAILAKLLYSVFLGVVLLVLGVISRLEAMGWWVQWLLVACLWWALFLQRHHVVQLAALGHRDMGAGSLRLLAGLSAARQVGYLSRAVSGRRHDRGPRANAGGQARERLRGTATQLDHEGSGGQPRPDHVPEASPRGEREAQAGRMLEVDERTHRARIGEPGERPAIETAELRLRGIDAARREAARVGDRRRELRLVHRAHRVGGELSDLRSGERARDRSARLIHRAEDQRWERGVPHASGDRAAREQWLDHQASLARGESASGERRDYRRLAALAGLSEQDYEALAPGESRRVRVVVDQALRDREPSANEPRDPGPGHRAEQIGEALRRLRERHGRSPRAPEAEVVRRRARQFGRPRADSRRERP